MNDHQLKISRIFRFSSHMKMPSKHTVNFFSSVYLKGIITVALWLLLSGVFSILMHLLEKCNKRNNDHTRVGILLCGRFLMFSSMYLLLTVICFRSVFIQIFFYFRYIVIIASSISTLTIASINFHYRFDVFNG